MSKWFVVKTDNAWRVVVEEYGIRSHWTWCKTFNEAYKMAKAMGWGKEPAVED